MDTCTKSRVKVVFCLGSETHSAISNEGIRLSEQISSVKEASMGILKEYIIKNNVPIDVPDEPLEMGSSEDDEEQVPEKSKKTKIN